MIAGSSKISDAMAVEAAIAINEGKSMDEAAALIGVGQITLSRAISTRGWRNKEGVIIIPYLMFLKYGPKRNAKLRMNARAGK